MGKGDKPLADIAGGAHLPLEQWIEKMLIQLPILLISNIWERQQALVMCTQRTLPLAPTSPYTVDKCWQGLAAGIPLSPLKT